MRFHPSRIVSRIAGICLILVYVAWINHLDQHATAALTAAVKKLARRINRKLVFPTSNVQNYTIQDLFPYGDEEHDRVLEQIDFTLPVKGTKTILVYRGEKEIDDSNKRFVERECSMTNCLLTRNITQMATADAILFKNFLPNVVLPRQHNPNQVWILYILESPLSTKLSPKVGSSINWTATYRRDSVLNTPYERFTPYLGIALPDRPARNYAAGKSKMVAWFVSNCHTQNGRSQYVEELQKYVDVDIYGQCGPLKCPRKHIRRCFDYLNEDYKFYLAFENANCKDYITEKFFVTGLQHDVLPVAMGAHPDDYRRAAPPDSFIHVDDFASPRHLAIYLRKLDGDDDLYNSYFRWKNTGEFIDTRFWCRLCSLVNNAPDMPIWYDDVASWWQGKGTCARSAGKWHTWKNVTRNTNFIANVKYGYRRQEPSV